MQHNRSRRAFVALLLGLVSRYGIAGDAFSLVTAAEFASEMALEARTPFDALAPKALPTPGAPVIELQKPQMQEALRAPFPIQLAFKAGDDAEIAPATFKVLYGMLKLDITDRVIKHATITKDGLSVENADIPTGSHKLLLQIRDTKDRKSETVMSFRVE